jgi:hypothetical protein
MIIMTKAKWHHLKLTECLMGAAILNCKKSNREKVLVYGLLYMVDFRCQITNSPVVFLKKKVPFALLYFEKY